MESLEGLFSSLWSEGSSLTTVFISIGILKVTDFAAKATGNLLRSKIRSPSKRYLVYFLFAVLALVGSNLIYRRLHEPNLYRKYGLTRLSSSTETRELYRRLAREQHPDLRNRGGDFGKMNSELKVLLNDRNRWFYDRFGTVPGKDDDEELGMQISQAISCLLDYLGKSAFILTFIPNDPNLNTKMSALTLVIASLLFDIYNITARRPNSKDPLDFVYYDLTIFERSDLIRTYFPIFFFLLIAYKFAFEVPWTVKFRDLSAYSVPILNFLQVKDREDHKPFWAEQERRVIGYFYYEIAPAMGLVVHRKDNKTEARRDLREPQETEPVHGNPLEHMPGEGTEGSEELPENHPGPNRGREVEYLPRVDWIGLIWSIGKSFLTLYIINYGIRYLTNL